MNLETLQAGFVGHMRGLNFKVDYNLFNVGLMKLPHFEMRDSALMFIQNTCCLCKPEQSEHEERKRTIVFDWFLDARDCERVGSFTWSRWTNKNISFLVLDIFCVSTWGLIKENIVVFLNLSFRVPVFQILIHFLWEISRTPT